MSLPRKIAVGLSSYAFQKFLDRYGEQIVAYASERGEEVVREYGPRAVNWTAAAGSSAYEIVAPRAAGAVSKLSTMAGRPAGGAVIPAAGDPENGRLAIMLFGSFAGSLGRIGAALRETAAVGAAQLGNLSDEQLGAIAVALWRAQNRDGFLGRRVRKIFWSRS